MTALWVCIVAKTQHIILCHMIFIGDTWQNMSETEFAVAPNVFGLNPSSFHMVPCNLGYINTFGVDHVGELQSPPQEIDGFLLLSAFTLIIFVLSQFLTKQPQLQLMLYLTMFFFSLAFPLCFKVIAMASF